MKRIIENAGIEIYPDKEKVEISFFDWDSSRVVPFAKAVISPEEFTQALGRSIGNCSIVLGDLSIVGKQLEHKKFEFELPDEASNFSKREKIAIKIGMDKCPEGWKIDNYYSSQDSFFYKSENGEQKLWAKTTIRRWIEKIK